MTSHTLGQELNIKMYLFHLSLLFFVSISEKVTLSDVRIMFKSI